MKKALKWTGIIIGGVIALLIVAGITLYTIGSSKFNKQIDIKVETISASTDSGAVARGEHIARTVGCVECHGENLAGLPFITESPMGMVYAPNLTSGNGGIGKVYRTEDWVRAIRHGVKRNGQAIMIMPSNFYTEMNRQDLADLLAFLQTLPPVDNVTPSREVGPMARIISGMSDELLPALSIDHGVAIPAAVTPGVTVEYGRYKAVVCRACHGDNLAGGLVHGPPGTPPSANITPDTKSGIGNWSEADFFRALREGTRPDGSEISAAMPRWGAHMTDEELRAIWLYLQSVAPVRTEMAKK